MSVTWWAVTGGGLAGMVLILAGLLLRLSLRHRDRASLRCRLDIHAPLRVIDLVEPLNFSPSGVGMLARVLAEHYECARCHTHLAGRAEWDSRVPSRRSARISPPA